MPLAVMVELVVFQFLLLAASLGLETPQVVLMGAAVTAAPLLGALAGALVVVLEED